MDSTLVTTEQFIDWLTRYKGPAFKMSVARKELPDEKCGCPMVEYALTKYPDATWVHAGRSSVRFSTNNESVKEFRFANKIIDILMFYWDSDKMKKPIESATLLKHFK